MSELAWNDPGMIMIIIIVIIIKSIIISIMKCLKAYQHTYVIQCHKILAKVVLCHC